MPRKTWTDARGKQHEFTDQAVVEDFLEGYIDNYAGQLESLQQEIRNLRSNVATLLLELEKDKVIKFCEENSRD